MKYSTSSGENELLPNKLGLTSPKEIGEQEYRGFLKATIYYQSNPSLLSPVNIDLLHSIHKLALGHLYDFAGSLRTVNISKGGFLFPAARFLPQICQDFSEQWMNPLNQKYDVHATLVSHLATVHAEMLFIHPYREGNGRTARLFTNLILIKNGFDELPFERITPTRMDEYILAVQSAADKNYKPMHRLFSELIEPN
ncbi:MAG: Fic family protein [Balneolales bacterium]|nr:Fic family protein [Balneolales bacterium]